jgi:rhodanese-related sulfurtransferase
MRKVKVGIRILFLMAIVSACSLRAEQKQEIKRVGNLEFELLLDREDFQLVDVRTPGEYQKGHLKDAMLIDITRSDFDEKIGALDREKPILVYCAVGGRSYRASQKLADMGFKKIYDLKDGIKGWAADGKEVVR